MPTGFLVGLAVTVVAILGAGLVFDSVPSDRSAVPMTAADAVLASVGLAGLVAHCAAMFFPSVVAGLPGADASTGEINALGSVSVTWYVVAAALVLLGLRRQHPAALVVVALALVAVGVTMYDGGPLYAHLAAIFVLVVILAGLAVMLVLRPWRRGSPNGNRKAAAGV